jgi:hypothetical protein
MQFREIKGTIVSVLVGLTDVVESAKQDSITLIYEGIVGDRHYGLLRKVGVREPHYLKMTNGVRNMMKNNRQVSILSEEELMEVAATLQLDTLPAEWVGANIITRGIPQLTLLTPSTRLLFPSGAALAIDGINLPCSYPGKVINKYHEEIKPVAFAKAAKDKRGVVAYVEREGLISSGDEVRVLIPTQRQYSF